MVAFLGHSIWQLFGLANLGPRFLIRGSFFSLCSRLPGAANPRKEDW